MQSDLGKYNKISCKTPIESDDYEDCSKYVVESIEGIMKSAILDPFAGSGTTLRVCQVLNRNCIGFELNPDYVDMIEKRLSKDFFGFDSIDERINRKPIDLPEDKEGSNEYWLAFSHLPKNSE